MMLVFVLGYMSCFLPSTASPHHDQIQQMTPVTYTTQSYVPGELELAGQTCEDISKRSFENIRIGVDVLPTPPSVAPKIRNFIKNDIMANAVNYFTNVLKVHPAHSPLKAGAGTCGPDNVQIPDKYKNQGAEGVDFFVFVTIVQTDSCRENGTLAYATHCVRDQCDRPIYGHINFCPDDIHPDTERGKQIATAIHELTHTLVFSSYLFKYFRNADGSPKMQRNEKGVVGEKQWQCSDEGDNVKTWDDSSGPYTYVDLGVNTTPAGPILGSFNERGMENCPCPIGGADMQPGCIMSRSKFMAPKCVIKMLTPKVVEKAREHFDCDSLEGPELENQPTSKCSIIGSHWEQRIFMTELMASTHVLSFPSFVSQVTLALFEDSGWYLPDYNRADALVEGVHWGYKQGCKFVWQACLHEGIPEFPVWCWNADAYACDDRHQGLQKCSLNEIRGHLPQTVREYFQPDASEQYVGSVAQADYCPFYATKVLNRQCTDTSSNFEVSNVNFKREIFSENSRCLLSTFHVDQVEDPLSPGTYFQAEADRYAIPMPACHEIQCDDTGKSYQVKIVDMSNNTIELGTCTRRQDKIKSTTANFSGYISCAAPEEMCTIKAPVYLGGPSTSGIVLPHIPALVDPDSETTSSSVDTDSETTLSLTPETGTSSQRPGSVDDAMLTTTTTVEDTNEEDTKKGPPWLIIGIIGGVTLVILVFVGVMCSRGTSKKSHLGSARDVNIGDGVQLSLQPSSNQPMPYNQPSNYMHNMYDNQPSPQSPGISLQRDRFPSAPQRFQSAPQRDRFPSAPQRFQSQPGRDRFQSAPWESVGQAQYPESPSPQYQVVTPPSWGVVLPTSQAHYGGQAMSQFGGQAPQSQYGTQATQPQYGPYGSQATQPQYAPYGSQATWPQYGHFGDRSHPSGNL